MGLQITVKGADFSSAAIAYTPAVPLGLEYLNYFGGDTAKTPRNLVIGKSAGSVVGAPGVNASYATFRNGTNMVSSGVLDQAEVTLLAVARLYNDGNTIQKYLIGSWGGLSPGSANGSNLLMANAASNPQAYAARRNPSDSSDAGYAASIVDSSKDWNNGWGFYAARVGVALFRVDDKTKNLFTSIAVGYPRSPVNGRPYMVGGSYSNPGGTLASVDIAFAAIYSRVISDGELETMYQRTKTYLATRSVAI